MNIFSLRDASINQEVYVSKIIGKNDIKRRFLDIGLSNNTKVTPILESISGGIRAYQIRNSLIAIRDIDAKDILVRRCD